jgi:hypothetical protein
VSIDTSDGYYNQRYLALVAAGRSEPVKRLKRAYVHHLLDRAAYYDNLARAVIGGLAFATIATLILVPIFYTLLRRQLPTLHTLDKRFEAEAAGSAAGGSVHG